MGNTQNFVVYKSSAGSGKTYTLVREYIALALISPGYFRNILAVTFTNKAANEMKQRVVLSLLHLSEPEAFKGTSTVKHMMDDLAAKTGFKAEEISDKAASVLSMLLHNYDDFAVRTIDSFVSRIIRTFAHDLNLPLDFEIEMDKDVLLDEAIDKLIFKAGVDPDITKILVEFTESKVDDEKSWHIENDLKKVGGFLFSEDGYAYTTRLREITSDKVLSIIKGINKFRSAFEQSIAKEATFAVNLIQSNFLGVESFYYGKQGIGAYFQNLSRAVITLPNSRVKSTIEDDNWYAGKSEPAVRETIDALKPKLLEIYQNCEQYFQSGYKDYMLFGMISGQLYQLGVISALEKELEEVKKERNVLHVSEFNKRITDIILKEPVPFIYERTGEKYRNYLIDEFQDTSDLQWKNLLPLIANSLASGQFNLVVGDGKQAIYRFRNGQVEQFMLLPGLPQGYDPLVFGDAAKALISNFKAELLGFNFRSLQQVVRFNNDFFHFISQRLDESLRIIYDEQEQLPVPGKNGGAVCIEFLENDPDVGFNDHTAIKVYELVNELTGQGYSHKDIAILTRSNMQGSIIARFLMGNGINVVSAEALLIATSSEVNFLVAVLKMLNDPEDVIASASVIISLDLWHKTKGILDNLLEIVHKGHFDQFLRDSGYDFNPSRLLTLTLYDLCEEIIRIFGLDGQPYNSYIQFFLEFVGRQVSSDAFQLADLLESWEEKKNQLSVVVPEGIDAVRIMTIHKAKGLEFPVVIWPFATETLKSTRDKLWIETNHPVLEGLPVALVPTNKELEDVGYSELYNAERNKSLLDMVNLIYVAFTRPVEKLFILTKQPGNSKSENASLPVLLQQYLDQTDLPWENEGTRYTLGEINSVYQVPGKSVQMSGILDSMISASWQKRIRLARRAPNTWTAGQSVDSQLWGNLVHECLSRVRNSDHLDEIIETIKEASQLPEEWIPELQKQVSLVIGHPWLKPYFVADVQARPESSILLPEGTEVRPDRVILYGNEAVILEFKTGKPNDSHVKQLLTYSDTLEKMGYEKIRRFLVYIDDEVIVKEI
ncbi:MAG: UvrD-helicase domain-containing protein [Bacteroidetes bacterium]|nr:UvrD-helicase domain-containing protein [Bacteroidota bacterium]